MPSLKPAQLERRNLNRRRCRKAAAQLAAEKTKEQKLQDEAAKRRAAAKAFSERTRRQHNAKLRERRGPPKGVKKKIDEERGEQLHAAVTLLEDSARLANRAREIVGATPLHEEGAPSEAAFAAAVAAAKAGAALGIAREYCWSVAMAAFAMKRQQRLEKIQAWKARRGRVAQVPADTEAEVAASASAPVGDAAGDDGDGDFAAAAVADIFPTYREIHNRGHDCWVIAALQMLRRMGDIHQALVGAMPTPCGEGKLLTTALAKAFRSFDKAGKAPAVVQPFLDVFFRIFPQFVDGQMDDASMALGAILDRLHDENTSAKPTPASRLPAPSPLPSIASPARMRVALTRRCNVCELESHSVVDQSILHINIPEEGGDVKPRDPSGWTLQELVENAMRPQESIDDRCQNCMDEKELQKAICASLEGPGGTRHEEEKIPQPDEEEQDQRLTISTRILHLPRYLCFSVVRFTPSIGNDSGFEKSNVAIDATKTLSLGDAFGDTAHASAKAELISVASHHGMSCGTGHWTTTWSMPGQSTTLGGFHTRRKQRRQPAKKRRQQAKQQATMFIYRTSGQL